MSAKQQVVIKIGYQSYLLPDDVGAATVIKCLSRGLPCHHFGDRVELREEPHGEISMSYLPKGAKITDEAGRAVQPEAKSRSTHIGLRKLKPQHVPALGWKGDQRLL